MISSLSGKPFSWEEARAQLAAIEALSLRERALLIVKAVDAVAHEIGILVRSGEASAWARAEKEFTRTIDALHQADQASRAGSMGEHYVARVDVTGASLDGFHSHAREYLQAGTACIHCTKSDDGHFAELGQSIMDQAAMFENRVRSQK